MTAFATDQIPVQLRLAAELGRLPVAGTGDWLADRLAANVAQSTYNKLAGDGAFGFVDGAAV